MNSTPKVCVVGSGTRFVSGISYYTIYLTKALADAGVEVSTILARKLLPRRLYPGRDRVGRPITDLRASDHAPTFDGMDWFVVPSVPRALRFLRRNRPDVVVLQWWTGTVLPAYLLISWFARRWGARVVIEFHEDLDTAESGLPLIGKAIRAAFKPLLEMADGFVVHSQWDRERISDMFDLHGRPMRVIHHGPYELAPADPAVRMDARPEPETTTVLFFGTIRPYKGLEDLVEAFELLADEDPSWRLIIAGETWEGYTGPVDAAHTSRHHERITLLNRYLDDDELPALFDHADVVALPYRRSSASGPLHLTMRRGLPVVVTDVGGLGEAVGSYSGGVLVPVEDPKALAAGLARARALGGRSHADPHDWSTTVQHLLDLASTVMSTERAA